MGRWCPGKVRNQTIYPHCGHCVCLCIGREWTLERSLEPREMEAWAPLLFPRCLENQWDRHWGFTGDGWDSPWEDEQGRGGQALIPGPSLSGPHLPCWCGLCIGRSYLMRLQEACKRGGRCCRLGPWRPGSYAQPEPLAWRPGSS